MIQFVQFWGTRMECASVCLEKQAAGMKHTSDRRCVLYEATFPISRHPADPRRLISTGRLYEIFSQMTKINKNFTLPLKKKHISPFNQEIIRQKINVSTNLAAICLLFNYHF